MYRNCVDIVNRVNEDYPGLITQVDGKFVDQVAYRLNKLDGEIRWGRKKKNSGEMNIDVLAYLNDTSNWNKKILVDIIINSGTQRAQASWQEYLGDNLGNGTWFPAINPDMDVIPIQQPTGNDDVARVIGILTEVRNKFDELIEVVKSIA